MDANELKQIVDKHEKWLKREPDGECADLSDADLSNADLQDAKLNLAIMCRTNLSQANLQGASLVNADLFGADLSDANLRSAYLNSARLIEANLNGANLHNASLDGANLSSADLFEADLSNADLWGTKLFGATLCKANLDGADLRDANLLDVNLRHAENIPFIPMTCPDSGPFIAWKTAQHYIVKLLIPEDARRSSSTGRKCRADKAFVLAIETVNGEPSGLNTIPSNYDTDFIYKVGETITVSDFCEDRFHECAPGIHFFINRQEAVNYR